MVPNFVMFLVTTSLQVGILLCYDQVDIPKAVEIVDLFDRMKMLEKRDNDRETERELWKQQMDDIKSQMEIVLHENNQLRQEIGKLNYRVTEMESECKELMNDQTSKNLYTDMQESDKKPTKKNRKLVSKIQKIFGGLTTSIGNKEDRTLKDNGVRNRREAASDLNRIQRADNELGVAFYAGLTNHLQHAGANQNIAFDHIYTNIGNAYNVHAGDFRAPVAGTYVFSTSLMAYAAHTTHYYFARNGSNVGNIYVRGQESPNASTSMTIVLRLNAGDDVAVRNVDPGESLHGIQYSSFSGFLLQQDYSVSAGSVIG